MEENKQSAWSSAAKDGLLLGLVTIVFLLLTAVIKQSAVTSIIGILKIVACIWFLRYLLVKWQNAKQSITLFKYGVMVCLFSSVICSIFTFFEFAYLFPDLVTQAFDAIYESLSTIQLPSETQDMLVRVEDNYPQWACISAFISDFLIGIIFSAIIASTLKSRENIFEQETETDQTEE